METKQNKNPNKTKQNKNLACYEMSFFSFQTTSLLSCCPEDFFFGCIPVFVCESCSWITYLACLITLFVIVKQFHVMFKMDVLWEKSGSNEVGKEEGELFPVEFPCSTKGEI